MTAEKKTLDEVKIRPMESRDISAVLEFDQRLSDAERETTYDEPYTLDQGGSLETSFVAETKGQVVGFIMARLANPGEPIFGEGLIQTIAVDPEYHPTEIATGLVNAVCFNIRFYPNCHQARSMVASGEIGEPRFITGSSRAVYTSR